MTNNNNDAIANWHDQGEVLARAEQSNSWAIADWLTTGEKSFGEGRTYDDAERIFRMSRGALRNYACTARAFPHEQRNSGVTFKHHRTVLPIKDEAKRAELLRKADEEHLSVAQLKKYLPVEPKPKPERPFSWKNEEKKAIKLLDALRSLTVESNLPCSSIDYLSETVSQELRKTAAWLSEAATRYENYQAERKAQAEEYFVQHPEMQERQGVQP